MNIHMMIYLLCYTLFIESPADNRLSFYQLIDNQAGLYKAGSLDHVLMRCYTTKELSNQIIWKCFHIISLHLRCMMYLNDSNKLCSKEMCLIF